MEHQIGKELDNITSKLKNTYLFNVFSAQELQEIVAYCLEETIEPQSVVFEEGDRPDKFYIVLSGEIEVLQSGPGKKNMLLATLQEGDFFGEMSLLDGFPRSATTKAKTLSLLLSMSFENFDRLMQEQKNIGIKWLWTFCRILSSRLRDTNEKYKQHELEAAKTKDPPTDTISG